MENETAAPEGLMSKELRRELEAVREELRNGLSVVQMDLKTVIRNLEWLTSDAKGVRSDIDFFRRFTIEDFGHLRRRLDSLNETLNRQVSDRRSPGDSAERQGREADAGDPGGDTS